MATKDRQREDELHIEDGDFDRVLHIWDYEDPRAWSENRALCGYRAVPGDRQEPGLRPPGDRDVCVVCDALIPR